MAGGIVVGNPMSPAFSYLCKLAADQAKRDRLLRGIDTSLPYAQKGLAGGAMGLWLGSNVNKLRRVAAAAERAGAPPGRALSIALSVVGAGFGVGEEKLRRMARQSRYRPVLKETRAAT